MRININKLILSKLSKNFTVNILLLINRIKMFSPLSALRLTKHYLFPLIVGYLIFGSAPIPLAYAWRFGSIAGITLVIQIISGIFLSIHCAARTYLAFSSAEYTMRDVLIGRLIRYIHANGASMFFIVVYGYVCRGLYYGSRTEPKQALWCSGVILLPVMTATPFVNYVLPWYQIGLWEAAVIIRIITAIPVAIKFSEFDL